MKSLEKRICVPNILLAGMIKYFRILVYVHVLVSKQVRRMIMHDDFICFCFIVPLIMGVFVFIVIEAAAYWQ